MFSALVSIPVVAEVDHFEHGTAGKHSQGAASALRHLSSDNAATVKHINQDPQQKEEDDVSRALP